MRIMIVDDEKYAMKQLCSVVEQAAPDAEIVCFGECDDAVEAAKHKNYDVAFLDIQMPEKDGLELAKELKDIYKDINIVFVTGYSQYALDALKIHCSGYVLKPAKKEDSSFGNFILPMPSIKEQIEISNYLNLKTDKINSLIEIKHQKIEKLNQYKKSIIYEYVTGKKEA